MRRLDDEEDDTKMKEKQRQAYCCIFVKLSDSSCGVQWSITKA